jgi:TIR domain/NB-ARC domain
MPDTHTPMEVFCCYSHKDELLLQELESHLSVLKYQGLISIWHDRQITPGTNWAQDIDTHLNSASVILLLVSSDFLASDYCSGIEIKRALERHQANEARVIPILVRPLDWKGVPFAHLQMLPTGAKPITTWSNQDEAFSDIVAGIRQAIQELSPLLANISSAVLPSVWNVPYSHNAFFTGREDILSRLHYQLRAGQAMALSQAQAISGLGGIGKTQTAVEYACQYRHEYQLVLWAQADSREALISSYVTIADLLKLPEKALQDQMITVQSVKVWLQRHSRWLLILDNADELALVAEFLPPMIGGHLLLTTRASALGRLAQRIEMETLSPEQGALFLLRRASLLDPDASFEQAPVKARKASLEIAQELGGLPLALDQAGAYLEETSCGLDEYLNLYRIRHQELLQRRGKLSLDHPKPVAATWSLSFQQVEQDMPAAAALLQLCAFLDPDTISEEFLTAAAPHLGSLLTATAADPFKLNEAIEKLMEFSLVRRNSSAKILSIHRLVQVVLKDSMSPDIQRQWKARVKKALNRAFLVGSDIPLELLLDFYNPSIIACATRQIRNSAFYISPDIVDLERDELAQRLRINLWKETSQRHSRSLSVKTWINQSATREFDIQFERENQGKMGEKISLDDD